MKTLNFKNLSITEKIIGAIVGLYAIAAIIYAVVFELSKVN